MAITVPNDPLVVLTVSVGYGVVAPTLDQIPFARIKKIVVLWLALFLLSPLAWSWLTSWLEDKPVTYLSELGHEWPVYTMFLSGLIISLWRRRRRPTL